MISFVLIIQVKMTKSSIFLLLKVGQVCLLRHSFFCCRIIPWCTHTLQLPMAFVLTPCSTQFMQYAVRSYLSYHPISVVQRSKVLKLPPDHCYMLFEATIACLSVHVQLPFTTSPCSQLHVSSFSCIHTRRQPEYISTSSKYMFYFTTCNCTSPMYNNGRPN